ncbi:MAG TPA: hypothetical protein VLJ79_06065 [Candidatus Binatia bacterium]|nr:hypothetical protein [Candidatus Binatia bacterium]
MAWTHGREKVGNVSESDRNAMIDECFVCDDVLRRTGLHIWYFTFHGKKSVLNGS